MTSFEFSFNTAPKPAGKVFARKRISKPVQKDSNKAHVSLKSLKAKIQEKQAVASKASVVRPKSKDRSDAVHEIAPASNNVEPTGYVKRKQKKDKLANKAANLGDTNNEKEAVHVNKGTKTSTHSLFAVHKKDLYVNTDIPGRSVVEEVFSSGSSFSDLGIHKYLVSNLEKRSFTTLTTVQQKSIPLILAGKNVLVRSQTGSGKTLAYAVPILNALQSINPRLQRGDGVQAVVIVPTRELALQANEMFTKINTFQWIVNGYLCGGENRNTEKSRLRKGVHVLIATPGRLLDHMLHSSAFKLNNVRCLVLDEADRLLDMGFKKDIVRIVEEIDQSKTNAEYDPLAMLKRQKPQSKSEEEHEETNDVSPLREPSSKNRQTMLLSATLNKGIAELADFTMKNHIYVDALDESSKINADHMVIPKTVKQEFVVTYVKHRLFTLSAVLMANVKHKIFVFMATGQMVDYHYELFTRCLVKMPRNRGKLSSGDVVLLNDGEFEDSDAEEEVVLDTEFYKLHGSMDQSARKEVFTAFRAAKRGVLLCTDVAARGVDVPEADCIIQYTGPQSDEDYLHRVGRTGRAGKSGSALIFLTHEEQEYISRLQDHKVFLKKREPEDFLKELCVLMEEPDEERAATALQRRYESAVARDKQLHKMACFAYSSWSRFYTYPTKMRSIFDFKKANLGHYVTSFALQETPSTISKVVRGQVTSLQPRKLNSKLATHTDTEAPKQKMPQKRKIKSISLTTSEFSSGLEPLKKKSKKKK